MGMTHIERFENAIACKPVDRTTYVNFDGGLIGKWISDEFLPGDMYTRPEWALDTIIEAGQKMGGDTLPAYIYGPMMSADYTGIVYRTPGLELPPEEVFQVIEADPLDDAGIDFILENGIQEWEDKYVIPNWPEEAGPATDRGIELSMIYAQKCAAANGDDPWYDMPLPGYGGPLLYSMTRGFTECLMDMYMEPDRTRQIMQMFAEWEIAMTEAMFAEMGGMPAVCIAMARFDDRTAGPESFDKVCWPVFQYYIDYAREHDKLLIVHADGYWTKIFNEHLHEFTTEKTLIQLDGFTDIDAVAENFVNNKICMQGDIPPTMLFMKNPKAVHDRVMHLKELYGNGLILSSGCGAPFNTDFDNLQAFIDAANEAL